MMPGFTFLQKSPGSDPVLQTRDAYEKVLSHHGQWMRWLRAQLCPRITEATSQPDPNCPICGGLGYIYRNPTRLSILQEIPPLNKLGQITPSFPSWDIDTVVVRYHDNIISLGTQTPLASYIQLASPFPANYDFVTLDYTAILAQPIVAENCPVVAPNTLKTLATAVYAYGKVGTGSVDGVTRVFDVTRNLTFQLAQPVGYNREFIYLQSMQGHQPGDVLQVDYTFVPPFNLVMYNVSEKQKFENSYVAKDSDSMLLSPYYVRPTPEDIFTAQGQVRTATDVLQPKTSGNDVLNRFFDVDKIISIVDSNGVFYDPMKSAAIAGRNQIQWLVPKPTTRYSVQFTYRPSYRAVVGIPTARFAENKSFVNRTSLKMFDRINAAERMY